MDTEMTQEVEELSAGEKFEQLIKTEEYKLEKQLDQCKRVDTWAGINVMANEFFGEAMPKSFIDEVFEKQIDACEAMIGFVDDLTLPIIQDREFKNKITEWFFVEDITALKTKEEIFEAYVIWDLCKDYGAHINAFHAALMLDEVLENGTE